MIPLYQYMIIINNNSPVVLYGIKHDVAGSISYSVFI